MPRVMKLLRMRLFIGQLALTNGLDLGAKYRLGGGASGCRRGRPPALPIIAGELKTGCRFRSRPLCGRHPNGAVVHHERLNSSLRASARDHD